MRSDEQDPACFAVSHHPFGTVLRFYGLFLGEAGGVRFPNKW
jgi:hypothetical protein